MNKKKIYKPKIQSALIISLILLALIIGNILFIFPLFKIVSIILCFIIIPLFILFFFPIVKYQRVRIEGDKIIIKCFWKTYVLSISKNLYEIYKNDSYRFHDRNRSFQISPLAYKESDKLKRQLNERIKKKLNKSLLRTG